MRDGVKIAADVLLPKKITEDQKLPTILIQTRYWRAMDLKGPLNRFVKFATNPMMCKHMVKYGYAIVETDVRGTGASYGNREYPIGLEEIRDGYDVIDWIIAQPWSNGEVVVWGNSYTAMTAECALSVSHPALKAGVIKHDPWDLYDGAMFPGGIYNHGFVGYWSRLGCALDQTRGKALLAFKPLQRWFAIFASKIVRGVKPVDKTSDPLEPIAKIHENNKYPENYGSIITYRDDKATADGLTISQLSIFTHQKRIEKLGVPMCCWGSWMDSHTANTVIGRFLTYSNPQLCVIGDWDHAGHHRANPYFKSKDPALLNNDQQIQEWVKFYDEVLGGNYTPEKILYYFTMGENAWKKTDKWPPRWQTHQDWYFQEEKSLGNEKPTPIEDSYDDYPLDFSVTTGTRNRWFTLLSLEVDYYDRKDQDKKLLTYTSTPLSKDIEITGNPIADLYLSSTHEDGMVCVYLEFLDGAGNLHFITDGQIRLIHRKLSSDPPIYLTPYPYHSYLKKDSSPMVPGKPEEIKFALHATSILLKKGSRLRVTIAGADNDTFVRIPSEGNPTLTVHRTAGMSSKIILPVIPCSQK